MAEGIPTRLTHSARREWMFRLILLTGSIVFALAAAEVVLRAFFPLYDGRANVDMNGRPIEGWFTPGSVYRQISNEYDAVTTITQQGHRVPGAEGSPDIIFLGDSFTYGYGLADEETFPAIYCRKLARACANLGMPGSGTARQVRRLEEFLERWQWRPREVKLFFFGMSSSFTAGNDFADNEAYGRFAERQAAGVPPPTQARSRGVAERVIAAQSSILEYSHLMRRAKYYWGPMLKSMLIVDPGDRLERALADTRRALQSFDALSRRAGFDYTIYVIVPVQDILRGSHQQTLAALNSVSPKEAIATAPLFVDSPSRYYFAYDGHLNSLGSRKLAEYLVSLDHAR